MTLAMNSLYMVVIATLLLPFQPYLLMTGWIYPAIAL
jgi:hypothetical protein